MDDCVAGRWRRAAFFVAIWGIGLILSTFRFLPKQPLQMQSAASETKGRTNNSKMASRNNHDVPGAIQESQQNTPYLDELLKKHPYCATWFQDASLGRRATARFLVETSAQFVRMEEARPRYDHLSCFVMKSRYNCAKGSDDTIPESAYWELVLLDPTNSGTNASRHCELTSFVDDMGGPSGLLRVLEKQQSSLTIMLEGNSYLRQVFEAFVCGFQHHLVDLRVVIDGPEFTMAEVNKREGKKLYQQQELGNIVNWTSPTDWNLGCHGVANGNISLFYGPNVTVPPTAPHCSDNIAMARFAGNVKISYLFRSGLIEKNATDWIYSDLLGWPVDKESMSLPNGEEFVLWRMNNQVYATDRLHHPSNSHYLVHEEEVNFLKDTLQRLQEQNAGRFWGADNVAMRNVPDIHPCMPGMPDDEVNVLLFSFLVAQHWKQKGAG